MTGSGDLDRRLEDWMRGAATAPYAPGQRDDTVAAAARRRPLPRWRAVIGSDWTTTPGAVILAPPRGGVRPWLIALLLLALLAAGLAGALVLGAWPPSPRVPFQLAYGRDGDIWTADWDGSNAVRIVDGSPPDGGPLCSSGRPGDVTYGSPIWSPDGRHIAFRGETAACDRTVSISDPDGSHLVTFPGVGWLIAWSPDSTRIATWLDLTPRIESPKFRTIGVYGVDGTRQALLAVDVTKVALEPGDFDVAWAPDGRSLLLPCQKACELPLDGGDVRYLSATDPLAVQDPALSIVSSPDGDSAAITDPTTGTLVVAGLDGSHRRVLIARGGGDPVWSPAGDRIAASTDTGDTMPPDALVRPSDAVVIDLSSGRTALLASGGISASWRPIRFSPAGDMVLLARTDVYGTDAASSLWSVRTDGTDLRQLVTGTPSGDWQPVDPGR
jgi:Tol biopolymer transport system component